MSSDYEKDRAVSQRIGLMLSKDVYQPGVWWSDDQYQWRSWTECSIGMQMLLGAMLDHGVDYTLDAHDGEHRARIYYRDKHGTRVQTEAQDRDAFTALRDALYQWVRATEEAT